MHVSPRSNQTWPGANSAAPKKKKILSTFFSEALWPSCGGEPSSLRRLSWATHGYFQSEARRRSVIWSFFSPPYTQDVVVGRGAALTAKRKERPGKNFFPLQSRDCVSFLFPSFHVAAAFLKREIDVKYSKVVKTISPLLRRGETKIATNFVHEHTHCRFPPSDFLSRK